SRRVPEDALRFAWDVGASAAGGGRLLVSGRAEGCDSAAAAGAHLAGGNVAEVLPCGLEAAGGRRRGTWLSVCAPEEPFSRPSAMERNALIYAFSPDAVVCHARFREGGSWHGAVDAARRRLTRLWIREADDAASRALRALGALPVRSPADLASASAPPPAAEGLFAFG
ncbi:MAG TPA: DNA-processing protein DprA, partial [Fimbriimonas sp.]